MKAIYKRELASYFHSFIGALFIAATLCLLGLYITVYNLIMGYTNMEYALNSVCFLFLISIPILTMRILSEERKHKTDQLILTAPIDVKDIVLGKYFAVATIFMIPVLVISLFPLFFSIWGKVAFLQSYVVILAFALYGLACIAIGVFVSSITENQIIAAVISFVILFLSYMMGGICNIISAEGNILTKILSALDMYGAFGKMIGGTLHITAPLYFVTMIVLFLYLTTQSILKRRYSISTKSWKLGAYNTTLSIVVIVVCVVINLLAGEIPQKYEEYDITANRLYSISSESIELAAGLSDDITIYVLVSEGKKDEIIDRTLKQYQDASNRIKVVYVDPVVSPKFATKYTNEAVATNSLIVESAKRTKVLDYNNLYVKEFDFNTFEEMTTGYDAEGQISAAITYVLNDNMTKVYALTGHGETEFDSAFSGMLAKANLICEEINLMDVTSIPDDCECLIINAPVSDLSSDDTQKVMDYIKHGKNVLLVYTWADGELPNYESILSYYQVQMQPGFVLEQDGSKYYQNPIYLLPDISSTEVTPQEMDNYIFAPFVTGIVPVSSERLLPVLTTSELSFSRADVEANASLVMEPSDVAGPFYVAVISTAGEDENASKAFITGCVDLFTDAADQMVGGSNKKLFDSTMKYLIDNNELTVSIPAKIYDNEILAIPENTILVLGIIITIIVPLLVLITGLVIWIKRRKA